MLRQYFQDEKKMCITGYILTFLLMICSGVMVYGLMTDQIHTMQWFFTVCIIIGLILSILVLIHGNLTWDGDAAMIAARSIIWFGLVLFIQIFSGFPKESNMDLYDVVSIFTWMLLIDVLVTRYELVKHLWYVIVMCVLLIGSFLCSVFLPHLGIASMIITGLGAIAIVLATVNLVKGTYRYYSTVIILFALFYILLYNAIPAFVRIDIISVATIGELFLNGFLLIGALKLHDQQKFTNHNEE